VEENREFERDSRGRGWRKKIERHKEEVTKIERCINYEKERGLKNERKRLRCEKKIERSRDV
jgi:hypothetical protein